MNAGPAVSIYDECSYVRDEFVQESEFEIPSSSGRKPQMGVPASNDPRRAQGIVAASELGTRPLPEMVSFGIQELDKLTGGIPRGALSEIVGPASSGRTSVLLAALAQATQRQEACALVDVNDCFDPKSAEKTGVNLKRLLWVRCGRAAASRRLTVDKEKVSHPLFSLSKKTKSKKRIYAAVEQALKAVDLLLQSGGFGLIVMDLAMVAPEVTQRIPLTSWFRFRRGVEKTSTAFLILEQEPYAKTCASLVVRLSAEISKVSASSCEDLQEQLPHTRLMSGLTISAEMLRSPQQQRKPMNSAGKAFESLAAWCG